jgi:hypothetical protein
MELCSIGTYPVLQTKLVISWEDAAKLFCQDIITDPCTKEKKTEPKKPKRARKNRVMLRLSFDEESFVNRALIEARDAIRASFNQ